jgi:hypothetical protein
MDPKPELRKGQSKEQDTFKPRLFNFYSYPDLELQVTVSVTQTKFHNLALFSVRNKIGTRDVFDGPCMTTISPAKCRDAIPTF